MSPANSDDSYQFVRSVSAIGPKDARLAVVGMAPEKTEVELNQPFVGRSGQLLNQALKANGMRRETTWIGNVSEHYLKSGQSLFSLPAEILSKQILRLKSELEQNRPYCILALGEEPLQILTGRKSILKQAGSILSCTLVPGLKCVVSPHPAWILRGMWKWTHIFEQCYVKRAVQQSAFPEIRIPTRNYIIGPSFNGAVQLLERFIDVDNGQIPDLFYCSFDIETMYWSRDRPGHIACIGFSSSPTEAGCIPFILPGGRSYWSSAEEAVIWQMVARVLQSSIPKVGQNLAFEWTYFWLHNIYPSNLWIDTMLLHHTLYPDYGGVYDEFKRQRDMGDPGHSLRLLNSLYTDEPFYKDDGRNWDARGGGIEHFWRYNCTDAAVTGEIALKLYAEAQSAGSWKHYYEYKVKPFYHYQRQEWDGIQIDIKMRDEAERETTARIEKLEAEVRAEVGYDININSSKQMAKYLYEERGYKPRFAKHRDKSGNRKITTDKFAKQALAAQHSDATLNKMMELSKLLDFRSDVVRQKLDSENKIHTHYKLGGTDGARRSSTRSILGTGTNLQNVPREGIARKLFLP